MRYWGWLAWLLSPTYRRRFAANSAQAGYAFDEVAAPPLAMPGAHGRRAAAPAGSKTPRSIAPIGAEVVEATWARGEGIVFLTPHLPAA